MADRDLTVHLKADDKITPAAKKAKSSLDSIPEETTVDVQAGGGLDDLLGKLGDLPGLLGTLGGAGAAGGVAALATGLFAAATAAKDLALEAQTTADLTGSTVEETSKLQNLWKQSGADVNDLNDVLLQMNGALAQSPELAKQLGINLDDGKDIGARFVEMTDKLAAGQLNAVQASQLFGEEGVRQVGKLRTVYGGLSDDLEGMPPPVSDEDVANALEMERAINKLKATAQAVAGVFAKELVPIFADAATVANQITEALPGGANTANLTGFLREWGTGLGVIGKGLDLVAGKPPEITASFDETTIAVAGTTDATEGLGVGLNRMGIVGHEALQKVVDDSGDAVDAITDVEFAAESASQGFARLRGQVDMKATIHQFQVDFLTAIAKVNEGTALTGDEILGLEKDILSVAEFAKLTPVQVQSLIDAVEHGDVEGVLRLVQNDLDANPAQLRVNLVLGRISQDLASIRQAERSVTLNAAPSAVAVAPVALGVSNLSAVDQAISRVTRRRTVNVTIRTMEESQERWRRLNGGG